MNRREQKVLNTLNKWTQDLTGMAEEHMEPGEMVLASVFGAYSAKTILGIRDGVLIATDQRIMIYGSKRFGGYELESFPYQNISSFEQSTNRLGHHRIKVFVYGNEVEFDGIRQDDSVDLLIREVKSRLKGGGASTVAPSDPTQQLRKYAALRDDGIITEEEFREKKKQLLS